MTLPYCKLWMMVQTANNVVDCVVHERWRFYAYEHLTSRLLVMSQMTKQLVSGISSGKNIHTRQNKTFPCRAHYLIHILNDVLKYQSAEC